MVHRLKSEGIEVKRPNKAFDFSDALVAYYSKVNTKEVWASVDDVMDFFPVDKQTLDDLINYKNEI